MTTEDTYAAACTRAADNQGLRPFIDNAQAQGLKVELWQTGGFTMVAAVRGAAGRVYTITSEGGYVVVSHPDEDSFDDPEQDRFTVLLDGSESAEADRAIQVIIDHDGAV